MRALDIVTSQPEWDGKKLIAHGRSQGGGQAIAAAGLDPRVTLVCAQISNLCDTTGMVVGRICGSPRLVPIDENGKPNEKALQAARYYDNMNWTTRTKAEGFFTVGFIDTSCPPTGPLAAPCGPQMPATRAPVFQKLARNWPHPAATSMPRRCRTVLGKPASRRVFWKMRAAVPVAGIP